MGILYEYIRDSEGNQVFDKNGKPLTRIVGSYYDKPKKSQPKKEETKVEKEEFVPLSHSKVIFNDAGEPITMGNGYSSEDVRELYEDENPENE